MVLTSAGNVGIGTTSPQTLLSIETSGVQNTISPIITSQSSGTTYTGMYSIRDGAGDQRGLLFQVYTANVGLNERMRITSGGNVGIGTAAPSYPLHLKNSTFSQLYIEGGTAADLILYNSGGSANVRTMVMRQTSSGYLNFFSANDSGTVNSNILTLNNSSGNVGIGTTAPAGGISGNEIALEISNANVAVLALTSLSASGKKYQIYSSNDGGLYFRDNTTASQRMIITSAGNVGIGTTAPGVSLEVNGLIRSVPIYNNTSANIPNMYISAGGTFERGTASSKRFKENITEWNGKGLDTILALKPTIFTYKESYYKHPERVMLGLIAEEVAEICPYLADYENEDGTGEVANVRYATIVVPLIQAIKELKAELDTLKNK
jgi:hypothetical protein